MNNKRNATLRHAELIGDGLLALRAQKGNDFQNFIARKFAVCCLVASALSVPNLVSGTTFTGSILHVVGLASVEKMVRSDASGIVAGVANVVIRKSEMKHEANDVSANHACACATSTNGAVFGALWPNPASVRLCDSADKSLWKSFGAIYREQKIWADKLWIQSPSDKFRVSHRLNT